jgi:hypothetical protein
MNGAGSALGGENIAPTMLGVTQQDIAEAIRIGPGQMPPGGGLPNYSPTDPASIQRVNDVAAYVEALNRERFNRGGAPIGGKGPVPEGFVAWVIGLGLLVLGGPLAWHPGVTADSRRLRRGHAIQRSYAADAYTGGQALAGTREIELELRGRFGTA